MYTSSKKILSHGSINLRKFTTNAPSLQSLVDSQEASLKNSQGTEPHTDVIGVDGTYVEASFPTGLNKRPTECKVLGVRWNVLLDQLEFSLDAMLEATAAVEPTKQVVISLNGRIYDPLGFLSPCSHHIFQDSNAGTS